MAKQEQEKKKHHRKTKVGFSSVTLENVPEKAYKPYSDEAARRKRLRLPNSRVQDVVTEIVVLYKPIKAK